MLIFFHYIQIKNEIITGINNRNFYLYDGYGTSKAGGKPSKGSSFLKELGMNPEEFNEYLNGINSFMFTQDGPEAGMYVVPIVDKKGRNRNLMITANNPVQKMSNLSNTVNQKLRSIDDTPWEIGDGYSMKLDLTLNPETQSFDHEVLIGQGTGDNFEPLDSYGTLDDIKVRELNNIVNSKVIGTQFNYNSLPVNRDFIPSIGN